MVDNRVEDRDTDQGERKGIQVTDEQLNNVVSEDQVKQRKILKVVRNKKPDPPAGASGASGATAPAPAPKWSFLSGASTAASPKAKESDGDGGKDNKEETGEKDEEKKGTAGVAAAAAGEEKKEAERPKAVFSFASLAKSSTPGFASFGSAAQGEGGKPVFSFKTHKITDDGKSTTGSAAAAGGAAGAGSGSAAAAGAKGAGNTSGEAGSPSAKDASSKSKAPMPGSPPPTGEEGDDLVLLTRAKIFSFSDGQWRECGLGDTRVSFSPQLGRARVVSRVAGSRRVILNALLLPTPPPVLAGEKTVRVQALSVSATAGAAAAAAAADGGNINNNDNDNNNDSDKEKEKEKEKEKDGEKEKEKEKDGEKGGPLAAASVEAGSFLVRVAGKAEAEELLKAVETVLARAAEAEKGGKPPKASE